MTYYRKKSNGLVFSLIILVAAVALVVLLPRGRTALTRAGLAVFRPIGATSRWTGRTAGNIFSFLSGKKSLVRQNNLLASEIDRLLAENSLLRQASSENEKLRELLGWARQNSKIILTGAEVMGFVPEAWLNKAIINKGLDQGISAGLGVINADGIVGRIIEAKNRTSIILLFTDTTSSFAAMCQRTGDRGLVSGRLCFPPLVNYISQGNEIKDGDLFVTAPGSQYFPAGIPIGTVIKKISTNYELFDQIYLRPAVRVSQLDSVFIVKRSR